MMISERHKRIVEELKNDPHINVKELSEKLFVSEPTVRRDLTELESKITELLATIQTEMLERAKAHREEHTYEAITYDEFKDIIANKPGFVKAMWCGDEACENKIKEDTSATSRCMPFEQEEISGTCICCGKPAKKMVIWGKAY